MYIGNDLQVAFPSYRNIDNISGSFNGVTTSFALLINGSAPVPPPLSSNQCLISVNGVIQKPDDTGASGFRLSGGNIIFSSAPAGGATFFGVVLAGADYVNAGVNFPDGSLSAPSITFDQDNDTGYYRSASGAISFSSNGVAAGTWNAVGVTAPSLVPTGSTVASNGIYLPSANTVAISTNSTGRLFIDSSGRLLVGTSTAFTPPNPATLQVSGGGIGIGTYVGASSGTYTFEFLKSRSSTVGGFTLVASSDNLGQIGFSGTDGTQAIQGATIKAEVDGTPGANDMPGRLVFSTTADGASSPTERMRLDSSGRLGLGTSSPTLQFEISNGTNTGYLHPGIGIGLSVGTKNASSLALDTNNTTRVTVTSTGNVGIGTATPGVALDVTGAIRASTTVTDVAGNVRAIPQNSQSGSYTLVASDLGKHISISSGGVTVPVGVFSTGDVVSIYNNSGSNQTISQGSSTLRQAGTANTGNRTLAQYGVATILCVASNTFVISGAGLT